MELKDLLAQVRIPKAALNLGWGISAKLDGRGTELRIARQIARQSNPSCKVVYNETQWDQTVGEEGDWCHLFEITEPNGHVYHYSVQAIKVDPKFIVAAAFYDFNDKHYMVVATHDCVDGHTYVCLKEDGTCKANN